MSGIYISGMEMPTDNTVLLRIYPESDGVFYVEQLDIDDDVLDKYWAVPVPEHGRLIDATAKVQTQLYDDEHEEWTDIEMTVDEYLGYCFNEVPTIIPAEDDTDFYTKGHLHLGYAEEGEG